MVYWSVPPLWPGATVVCIGGGPSLAADDVDYCRGKARVIAVNNAYRLAPWADILYACGRYTPGPGWWKHYPDALNFTGLKVTLDEQAAKKHGLHLLRQPPGHHGAIGLEMVDRTAVRGGLNSGYQAIGLSVHLGAKRILLLGYDMKPAADGETHHWHGNHPQALRPPYKDWLLAFETLPDPLKAAGVEVINCTRDTALTTFPRMSIQAAL